MVSLVVNSRFHHFQPHFRHRDEKPVIATPLDSAFTNRDAHNSFRIRIYENCRVSSILLTKNLKFHLRFLISRVTLSSLFEQRAFQNSLTIKWIRTLFENSRVAWVFLTKILKEILEVASQYGTRHLVPSSAPPMVLSRPLCDNVGLQSHPELRRT